MTMATSTIIENGKANDLGSVINISSYTSNFYTFPSDGYIRADASGGASQTARADIYGRTNSTPFRIGVSGGNSYPVITTYVRKGMRCKVVSVTNGGTVTFFPIA